MKGPFLPGGNSLFHSRMFAIVISPLRYCRRIITVALALIFLIISVCELVHRQNIIISISSNRQRGDGAHGYEKGAIYGVHLAMDLAREPGENMNGLKPLCPAMPEGLGPVDIVHPENFTDLIGQFDNETALDLEMASLISETAPSVKLGGFWEPSSCIARYRSAVVIPYRDRLPHLYALQWRLHSLLQAQMIAYGIFVTEQEGEGVFNKGRIMNAAFLYIRTHYPTYDCLIFHDVDMLPEDDRNMYACSHWPKHLSPAVDTFKYILPYTQLVGGVFAISTGDFMRVNGYSNSFWGWGGEDDDMYARLEEEKLKLDRSPRYIGSYTMMTHTKRKSSPRKYVLDLLKSSKQRYKTDGLDQLLSSGCSIVSIEMKPIYTRILVDVGSDAPWLNVSTAGPPSDST